MIMTSLLVAGCWEKQSHELLPPEIPHYQLTGSVVDQDTQLPLPNTEIQIRSVYMIYAVEWATKTLFTDSVGFFKIDTIYPGTYTATIYRDGYVTSNFDFMITHADRDISLSVPEPLVATSHLSLNDSNPGVSNPLFTWQGSILWMVGIHQGYIQHQYYPSGVNALMPIRISGNVLTYAQAFLNPSPGAMGLVYANAKLYAYGRYSVDIILPNNGQISSTVPLSEPISGLTFSNDIFYSTWGSSIQVRGNDISQVQTLFQTETGALSHITKFGDQFWAYDQDREFVVVLDSAGIVLKSYKLFPDNAADPIAIHYLSFDTTGQLWVSSENSINFYRFEQTIPTP